METLSIHNSAGPKRHIKETERLEISILLQKHYSIREISSVLGRNHTSISREISRNSVNGEYDPRKANFKAKVRRKQSKYQGMKIRCNNNLEEYIQGKLRLGWTPELISGRLKEIDGDLPYVSHMGIYKWLYSAWGQTYCGYLPSKRSRKRRRRKKKGKRSIIPNRTGILHRSNAVNERKRFGHFEGDTIVSGKRHRSKVSLSVLYERKGRYVRLRKIPNLKPNTNADAIVLMSASFNRFKSLTLDNGIENAHHEQLPFDVFFCDPYASWQKGGVEQTNGLIRRFIPKGADIAHYSDEYIARIEYFLNHTPRKCLNFKTPYEIMSQNNLLNHPKVVRLRA